MKAIVNTGPDQLTLLDTPLPEPGPGQVRIRTAACGICATDLLMIAGWQRTPFPAVPGHEWSGRVDAIGAGVEASLVGQPCVAENVLADGGEVGFEYPGGYGEYLLTEARNVRTLPADFPIATAALIEPLAVVTRALKRLRLINLKQAVISGDGPIGLPSLMLLRRAGVEQVVVIGGRTGRLALASALGADAMFNALELGDALVPAIQGYLGGPVPTIIEASGAANSMPNALQLIAREGQILLIGDYHGARADFLWKLVPHLELEIVGSNASAGAWDEAVRLAVEERLPLERLISHTFPAMNFEEAFALVRSQRDDVAKVILKW